jgi:hypothetical protein
MSTTISPLECAITALEEEQSRFSSRSELSYHYKKMIEICRLYLLDEPTHELLIYKEGFKDAVKIKNHEHENFKGKYQLKQN